MRNLIALYRFPSLILAWKVKNKGSAHLQKPAQLSDYQCVIIINACLVHIWAGVCKACGESAPSEGHGVELEGEVNPYFCNVVQCPFLSFLLRWHLCRQLDELIVNLFHNKPLKCSQRVWSLSTFCKNSCRHHSALLTSYSCLLNRAKLVPKEVIAGNIQASREWSLSQAADSGARTDQSWTRLHADCMSQSVEFSLKTYALVWTCTHICNSRRSKAQWVLLPQICMSMLQMNIEWSVDMLMWLVSWTPPVTLAQCLCQREAVNLGCSVLPGKSGAWAMWLSVVEKIPTGNVLPASCLTRSLDAAWGRMGDMPADRTSVYLCGHCRRPVQKRSIRASSCLVISARSSFCRSGSHRTDAG